MMLKWACDLSVTHNKQVILYHRIIKNIYKSATKKINEYYLANSTQSIFFIFPSTNLKAKIKYRK